MSAGISRWAPERSMTAGGQPGTSTTTPHCSRESSAGPKQALTSSSNASQHRRSSWASPLGCGRSDWARSPVTGCSSTFRLSSCCSGRPTVRSRCISSIPSFSGAMIFPLRCRHGARHTPWAAGSSVAPTRPDIGALAAGQCGLGPARGPRRSSIATAQPRQDGNWHDTCAPTNDYAQQSFSRQPATAAPAAACTTARLEADCAETAP